MLEMSTESKFLGRCMKMRIVRCMIRTQKTSRRTTGTSAIRCIHVHVLLAHLSRPQPRLAELGGVVTHCTTKTYTGYLFFLYESYLDSS
jgi:hypothetical protein